MKKIHIIIIILAAIIVVGAVGYVALRRVAPETYAAKELDAEGHWGVLQGSLAYPSEGIPSMGVCAESVTGVEQFCTYKILTGDEFEFGYGYELKVPPDTYHVFAHLVEEATKGTGYTDEYKAYYSEFITCGGDINCKSHKPVSVKVDRNATVQNIDPVDWFADI